MPVATFMKDLTGFTGMAKLYRVSESVKYENDDDKVETTDYIVVSAAHVMLSGPETYIFPSDEDGNVLSWMELKGSFRGALDCSYALESAGYIVEYDLGVHDSG